MKGYVHYLDIHSTVEPTVSKLTLTDAPAYDFKKHPWQKEHLKYARDQIKKILRKSR